jgi:hypothetical protein
MSFGKRGSCPTSEQTLSYIEGSLEGLVRERIATHLSSCDFCGAEFQLLSKFALTEQDHTPGPVPSLINLLSVNLPLERPLPTHRRRAA